MKRARLIALPLVLALALFGCGKKNESSGGPKVRTHTDVGESAHIVIEAENATIEPPVKAVEEKEASGSWCIAIPGDAGKPGEEIPGEQGRKYPDRWGAATYRFTTGEAGRYRFWGRKFWEDGCGNSFTLVVNGGSPVEFGGDSVYEKWDWAACTTFFDLKKGENTLEVLNREDGVKLDKIIFTKDLDFIPQGKE